MFHDSGGYGRYAKVSRAALNLVPLPASIPFVDAAGLGCRYMTAWHGVVDRAAVAADISASRST
jgi:NADPH:quinone reductase-like Zn-dependent oxidoreductase